MSQSDAIWIAEITTLRTRLSEAEAENAYIRLRTEAMRITGAREIPSATALIDRAEKAEAALKEAQTEAAINADSCVKNANGWEAERCKVAAVRGRLVELAEVIAAIPGVFPVLNPLMDLVRSIAPYECEEKRKREEAERARATAQMVADDNLAWFNELLGVLEKVRHALKDTCNCDPSIDDAPLCVSCEALASLPAKSKQSPKEKS